MSATRLVYNLDLFDLYAAAALNAVLANPNNEHSEEDAVIIALQHAKRAIELRGNFYDEGKSSCSCVACVTHLRASSGSQTSDADGEVGSTADSDEYPEADCDCRCCRGACKSCRERPCICTGTP